ncbi:MAG: hypothetical protein US70_C0020G0013 [Parcubacteria group bacterium GW2011_GWD2_38_11]|nr:MAG: hypothetical protein US70_C0020G0013 [Parcubacteria group bacterium GW2011_GWD2_38_11]
MKIEFTNIDTEYACNELGSALRQTIPAIKRFVLEKYSNRQDERTLVVVFMCPCCNSSEKLYMENAVLVSPFRGIDRVGHKIECVDVYPPFREQRKEEAKNVEEFLQHFETTVEKALA